MKKNITQFVANYQNCQQVNNEHQNLDGLAQGIHIPTLKWKDLNIDFITGSPRTHHKFDFILVTMNRMTNLTHFLW